MERVLFEAVLVMEWNCRTLCSSSSIIYSLCAALHCIAALSPPWHNSAHHTAASHSNAAAPDCNALVISSQHAATKCIPELCDQRSCTVPIFFWSSLKTGTCQSWFTHPVIGGAAEQAWNFTIPCRSRCKIRLCNRFHQNIISA